MSDSKSTENRTEDVWGMSDTKHPPASIRSTPPGTVGRGGPRNKKSKTTDRGKDTEKGGKRDRVASVNVSRTETCLPGCPGHYEGKPHEPCSDLIARLQEEGDLDLDTGAITRKEETDLQRDNGQEETLADTDKRRVEELLVEYGFTTVDGLDADTYRLIRQAQSEGLELLKTRLEEKGHLISAAKLATIGQKLAQMEKDKLQSIQVKIGKPSERAKSGTKLRARIGVAAPTPTGADAPAKAAVEIEVTTDDAGGG